MELDWRPGEAIHLVDGVVLPSLGLPQLRLVLLTGVLAAPTTLWQK